MKYYYDNPFYSNPVSAPFTTAELQTMVLHPSIIPFINPPHGSKQE